MRTAAFGGGADRVQVTPMIDCARGRETDKEGEEGRGRETMLNRHLSVQEKDGGLPRGNPHEKH